MHAMFRLFAASTLLAVASVAAAATSVGAATADRPLSAADSSAIIVQGVRERNREVQRFVDALTEAPIGGQISRFEWAVCPAAVGLSDAQNQAIVQRMRRVAEAAGMRLARAKCKANALVIVVDQQEQFIEALYAKYPDYFVDTHGKVRRPRIEPGPVAAWHVEALLDPNGVPAARDEIHDRWIVASVDASRLLPPSRPHFAVGVLVVEANALAGLTTAQFADYAAMRIFARTDPARLSKTAAPTILTLLDTPIGGATPLTLTHWDLSFLKSLYASGERQYANRQRQEMRSRMRRELDNAGREVAPEPR